MSAISANVAVTIAVMLAGISVILAGVALTAYRRIKHGRLMWVAIAMIGFAAQGIWLLLDFYSRRSELAAAWDVPVYLALANLAIVLALYMAVLRD